MKKLFFVFVFLTPLSVFSQLAVPYDELTDEQRWEKAGYYMNDNRALELRPLQNVADSVAACVEADGKTYQRFTTRQEAIDFFTAQEVKSDYTIFYVNEISAVEVFEEQRKVLRKQFYNREELPKVISGIIQLR